MKKLLKFSASWCQPCQVLSKNLKTIDLNIEIEEIDVDENREKTVEFGIRSVPTLVLVEDDKVIDVLVGSKSNDEINKWIEKYD